MNNQSAPMPSRKVSLLLGVGIALLPFVFSWFTLRKGHSALARVISLGWLALCVIFLLSPTPPGPPPPTGAPAQVVEAPAEVDALASLRRANRDYRNIDLTSGILHVEVTVRGADAAAREVERIGKWLKENPDVTVQSLEVAFDVESVDRLGNEGTAGLFVASFDAADLRAARFENLLFADVLGLSQTARVSSQLGARIMAEWCADPKNIEFTGRTFCARLAS